MSALVLQAWAGWAPGLESDEDWRRWARSPGPVARDGLPDVRFLPAMQRRRCDPLSRMMLAAASRCCDESLRGEVSCVFASRHGAFATTASMLEDLAAHRPLSPTRFSHSVHNTTAGLYSIWAGNQQPAQSLAAGVDTFAHGFLEALCLLDRQPGRPVLFVSGDETLPDAIAPLSDDPDVPHAVALLLGRGGEGTPLEFGLECGDVGAPDRPWTDAMEFLRWWLSEEPELRICRAPRLWTWSRGASAAQSS